RAWARVETFRGRPAVVLARDVRKGEVLTLGDLDVRSDDATRPGFSDPEAVVGKRLTRSLAEGTLLSPRDLESPPVIARGDTVRLVARVGGVVASTLGKALEPAGAGEVVRVENLASGKAVSGVVREGGVVDVTPGLGR
ncbi:MAG: flagellar basal body P-ring formation chaperone FlgA, partial [Deferrisomatales bacterium]